MDIFCQSPILVFHVFYLDLYGANSLMRPDVLLHVLIDFLFVPVKPCILFVVSKLASVVNDTNEPADDRECYAYDPLNVHMLLGLVPIEFGLHDHDIRGTPLIERLIADIVHHWIGDRITQILNGALHAAPNDHTTNDDDVPHSPSLAALGSD